IETLLSDEHFRAELGAHGVERADRFDWGRTVAAVLDALPAAVPAGCCEALGVFCPTRVDAEHGSRTKEPDQMSTDTEESLEGGRAWAEANDVAVDSVAASEIVVTLPGERKLKTNVAISIFARTAHLQAFVIRHPDENSAEFNRWLLQKNLKPGPVTFAIDSLGDVYLRTSVPREHLLDELDALLGAMLDAADSSFNELLLIGFLTGMKKEWAWRVRRGESTRNLAAFEQVLSGEDNGFLAAGPEEEAES